MLAQPVGAQQHVHERHHADAGDPEQRVVLLFGAYRSAGAGAGDPGRSRPVPAARSTLCRPIPSLDRLTVRRTDAFPENHLRFSFPADVTVTDALRVRAAARALCSLPRMPSGVLFCPADFGIVYHLAFTAGERALAPVGVNATGCQWVHGLGRVRWVARSPRFWATLGGAMGLTSPDSATFRGRGPNG